MEDALENLKLQDQEEEAFQEDEGAVGCVHHLCLVGRCLIDSVIHFPSLHNTMVDLWHPIGGIYITEIGEKRYFFQFFMSLTLKGLLVVYRGFLIGVNPAMMEINHTEFWIQKYLRIRVCLNVAAPLNRKKKVLVQKTMVVYARFKYEKLSLFCFICRKLGHGESYCPFRLTIDSSKIVFGWDLSLRAVVRRRNMVVSRLLRAIDGSPCSEENLAGVKHGNLLNVWNDLGLNSRGFMGNLNPNLIPLGSAQIQGVGKTIKVRDGCINALNANGLVYGAMELVSDEENDLIT
ncbi:hypothetical protein Goshw_006813 [Gossypium schwendimanii]|uniref:Zinc knuckle CX2CX4HX4C domain-containing protein n=1 Tax=Gossypium schwendimanii TaxID=34291 RepID=A0A7J9N8L6_GOSSC|nr:hypothetical protein [Gossypium schwendimanii]